MSRRSSLGEVLLPIDEESRRLAVAWAEEVVEEALSLVWKGFDLLAANELKGGQDLGGLDPEQLERELTQWHSANITTVWARTTGGYGSFVPSHEHHEFERRKGGKAVPPSNDIGFVHRDKKRWCLPVEAKLLPSARALSEYLKDVTVKYAEGVAAPLVGECGMVGYLLRGTTDDVLARLSIALKQPLLPVAAFPDRAHRTTNHARVTAPMLRVHHMILSCVPSRGPGPSEGGTRVREGAQGPA